MEKFLNKFYFRNIHRKIKTRRRKYQSILEIVLFNLEIPLGSGVEEKRRGEQWTRKRGNCGDRKKRGPSGGGEQLYNPNLSRDFRPLICFLASRNRYLLRANDRSSYEFRENIFDKCGRVSICAISLPILSPYRMKGNKIEPSPGAEN